MGMVVNWLVPDRVVQVYAWDVLTIEELHTGAEETRQYFRKGTPLVHDVVDMRHMDKFPTKLNQIVKVTTLFDEENLGWVILLSGNPLVRFLASMTVQMYGARFRAFADPEEAMDFLRYVDVTLPEIPPYREPDVSGKEIKQTPDM